MPGTIFEQFYRQATRPPWDLDGPSPFVVRLEAEGRFRGAVLDAGCGTGENALFLAANGYAVTGVDAAPTAIARARGKAQRRGLRQVTFVEADACELPGMTAAFDTVLDSGFFHVLSSADQRRYVAALERATRPAATLHLLAFSDRTPAPSPDRPAGCFTHGVSEDELRQAFSSGWCIESLEPGTSTLAPPDQPPRPVSFWLARLRRL